MAEENKAVVTSVQEEAVQHKKSDKVQKTKKPGFFSRVAKWFRELKSEAKKVVWPNSKQVVNNTVVVFVVAAIVMVVVYVMDVTFGTVRDLIITLVS